MGRSGSSGNCCNEALRLPAYEGDNFEMIGRLRDGTTISQVQSQLNALNSAFYHQDPEYRTWTKNDDEIHQFRVWKLQDVMVSNVRRSLLTVIGAVLAVLLVARLNLAGLFMARAMRRSHEIASRF